MNAEFLDKVLLGEVEAPSAKSFIKEIKRLQAINKALEDRISDMEQDAISFRQERWED